MATRVAIRSSVVLSALVFAAIQPGWGNDARAEDIDATLTTLMMGRQDPRDDRVQTVIPIYELISIQANDIKNPWVKDLNLTMGAWGRVDGGEPLDDRTVTGDVDVAYIDGKLLDDRLAVRLGRQMIIGGAARNVVVDGLSAQVSVWRKLGVTAYGGHPVTRHFELDRGDAVAGTRVFWHQSIDSGVGVSFIHQRADGQISRQDVGLDARYRPLRALWLRAAGQLSTTEGRIAELDFGAQWQATRRLEMHGEYRRTAPDLFLPRNSILSVFSEEQRDEVGGRAFFRAQSRIRTWAGFHFVSVEAGNGTQTDGGVTVDIDQARAGRVGTEFRYFDAPENGYIRTRLLASYRVSPLFRLSADADTYFLKADINGQDVSVTGLVAASYDLPGQWSATVVGIGGATPFLRERFEVMAKLVYGRTRRVREVSP